MSSEQYEHIQSIRNDFYEGSERLKTSSNNSIRTLADDLYNKHTHFIFELIQNAEDNTYDSQNDYPPYISLWLTKMDPMGSAGSDGALIIQNNEIGFNSDNVDAICAVGETTKEKRRGYIGEKGIGFKSVFRVTGNPHIFSNGYHFCLPKSDAQTGLGYIVPQWIHTVPEGLDLSETHIILPLTERNFGYEVIEEMLQDIEPEVILFLSTLQEIQIKTDTGDDFTILKDDSAMPEVQILVDGKKQGDAFSHADDFLVCTERYDKPIDIHHEKREGIENREVTIAFPLNENATAVGKIFAYLPVREGTGFPFLINSDFILPSSREEILDVPWNRRWLMECVADLTAKKLLPLLKEQKFLRISFLEKLASKLNNLAGDENDLFYPVFSRLRDTFVNEEMLPAHDKTFVSAQDAKLADSEGLIGLLDSNQLGLLFKKSGGTKWLLSDITARRTQNLWKYLRNELGIDEVDPEMFARRIDKPFLEQQSDDWFIDFYRFLSMGERPPRSLWTVSSNILQRSGILLSKPILRLQDNSLVNPNESNVYLSKGIDSETTSRLIKSEISQNEDAHKFLKELDVAEWDLVAEVIEHIVPKYRNNASAVPKTEYYTDFSKIVNAYATDSQKKRDRLLKNLMTTPFILVETPSVNGQIYLRPDQLYFGTGRLWQGKSNGNYLPVSVDKKVSQFLKELDIPQWNAVEEVIKTILPKYKQNPPKVSIETHMNDFKKITHAYKISDKFRKDQLKEALQASHCILAEHPEADFPIYLKPSYLYFPSDALRMYFENHSLARWVKAWNDENEDLTELWNYFVPGPSSDPPIAGAFVNLDRYANTDWKFFKDLGVASTVRVKRKEQESDGHVAIKKQHGKNMRGIKGFDPDIRIDGLEFIIEYVRCTKMSAFIWNEIVLPNADCIRGIVETSRRSDFSKSSSEEVISPYFGQFLIDNAWLPDSDGVMHQPGDITLDDLPDSFQKNERLSNQLGMRISKTLIIDLVAPEIGVSSDILNGIVNAAPETIQQIQSLLQSWPDFDQSSPSPTPRLDRSLPLNLLSFQCVLCQILHGGGNWYLRNLKRLLIRYMLKNREALGRPKAQLIRRLGSGRNTQMMTIRWCVKYVKKKCHSNFVVEITTLTL